jgi:hypothetical protein
MKNIEKLVNEKARIGMELILGDKTLKCINMIDTDRGTRYIFDNGMGWTKSNIVSNLNNAILQNKAFGIA